ncbi:fatty acyl-CoA hydrolase [Corynespora cassiicola Philippines]|uniref:Fatty acyl-CoA hydrolase n=1 Tax=Corynespora cassiicola Philippines TaxID=1448308 RepID=A0A2T2NX99_CORCC|nr:fatty acyl-CoA hydrolase [Corynespora cassiicola Philippines]
MKLAFLSLLAYSVVRGRAANCSNSDDLTVKTSTGTYTGLIDPEFPRTRQFRAVPFAQPPVGSLRWEPPQKLSPSNALHIATRFPPSCPQFVTSVISLFNTDLTKGNLIYNGFQNDTSGLVGEATSEDCLYLAVWTPTADPPEGGWPVLFFMTGGGWVMGGVDIPWQMPTGWVEREQRHIVVTINYRVGVFGFPQARGLPLEGQNLGILDQRAALEWVRDNVEAFGGNPARITQWGRSASATGTDIHAYAFSEDPIAQAYYMQSGTVFSSMLPQTPSYSNFSFVAKNVGCAATCGDDDDDDNNNDDDGAAELDCMRQVPFTMITNFIGQYSDLGEGPRLLFVPVVDETLIFADYKARSEAGLLARIPTLISFTANEFSSLVPWPIENLTAGPDQAQITAWDIEGFVCPSFNSTVYRNRLDVPVYRMQHAGTFPNLNRYEWMGAWHASDIPISFGTYRLLDHVAPSTRFEQEVSEMMQEYILVFVEDPESGPERELGWRAMDTEEADGGVLARFGAGGRVVQHIAGREVDGVCLGVGEYDPFP